MRDAKSRYSNQIHEETSRQHTSLDLELPSPQHSVNQRRPWIEHNHQSQSTCDPAAQRTINRETRGDERSPSRTFCILVRIFLWLGSLPYRRKSFCSSSVNFCEMEDRRDQQDSMRLDDIMIQRNARTWWKVGHVR
jgi:hypothetical protein